MDDKPHETEWPLSISESRVADEPLRLRVEADSAAREALASRFGILSIERLAADLLLLRATDDDIVVKARLHAHVTQACVVSLEPVAETIDVEIEGRFSHSIPETLADHTIVDVEPDDDSDEPEPIVGGAIRLGEWLAQQLSLAMNPYPRADEAVVPSAYASEGDVDDAPTQRPFAGLGRLIPNGDRD